MRIQNIYTGLNFRGYNPYSIDPPEDLSEMN